MTKEDARSQKAENSSAAPGKGDAGRCEEKPQKAGLCGTGMEEMMKACPCAGAFKRHRFVVCAVVVGIGLALLVLQVGSILGIIAFFRTI